MLVSHRPTVEMSRTGTFMELGSRQISGCQGLEIGRNGEKLLMDLGFLGMVERFGNKIKDVVAKHWEVLRTPGG